MNKKMKKLLSILKSYDYESYLATDEDYNLIDISNDPYLADLIEEGEYFIPKDGMVCDKPKGSCHKSVCEILENESEEGDILYTGFAKNHGNDEWFTHSFIVNNDIIIEPGDILFKAYFGIPLAEYKRD